MATGHSKMRTKEVKIPEIFVAYNGNMRQIKSRGIREPWKRVKGYRVEIRPPNSKKKIWVGTFGTRTKAMRAFDVAVYLIGKDPYYYIYPKNYFPRRPSQGLKEAVQAEAKKYAEKTDSFPVNPLSLLSDTSTCAPRGLAIPESGSRQPTSMNRQVIIPTDENLTSIVEEVDAKFLTPTQQEDFDEFLEASPYHGHQVLPPAQDPWSHPQDLKMEESVKDDEAKVPAAYLRGLLAPNNPVVNDLLDYSPPENFNFFPYIKGGESILDVFEEDESSSKLIPFKRERETPDALADHFDVTSFSWSTPAAMQEDYCTSVGDGRFVDAYEGHPLEDWALWVQDRRF